MRTSLIFLAGFLLVGCQSGLKTFYPLGIYSPASTNNFPAIRSAGFNVITGSADEGFLRAAKGNELRVLASIESVPGRSFASAQTEKLLRKFDSDPQLWAWYVVDEPDLNEIAPMDVQRANHWIKRFASKPTALVLFAGSDALHYAGIPDIMMIDRYPVPWLPLANFSQNVRLAKFATGQKKKLIAVIQAFDWSYYPELLKRPNLRVPTRRELRCMAYSALAEGANGLFFYCYDDGKWRMSEHPQTWVDVRAVVAEVNQRLPLFSARQLWTDAYVVYENPENGWNEALESSITTTLLEVRKGNDLVQAGAYLLAVNTTARELKFQLKISSTSTNFPVFQEDRTLTLVDGLASDAIQPYEVHIYGPLK